jgi:hypothetical protein
MIKNGFMKTNTVDIEVDGIRYNSLSDFGLAIGNTEYIKSPVQDESNLIFVPGKSRPLDPSESVFGETIFKYRKIEIQFGGMQDPKDWDSWIRNFRNKFEGKEVKLYFFTDPEWYWIGKAKIEDFQHKRQLGEFNFVIPYADAYQHRDRKIQVATTAAGTVVELDNSREKVVPTITTSATITITCGTNIITMAAGTWQNTALALKPGVTEWTIKGNSNVTIEYTEGSL